MKFSLLRFTNSAILAILVLLGLTGIYGLFFTLQGWLFDLHRLAGWFLIALIPWKAAISWSSLRRGLAADFDRGVMIFISLVLAAATILVVLLGIEWNWRLGPEQGWLRQTILSWHWLLGLGLGAPLALHVWRRWPRPKKVDFISRRAFLKMAAAGAAGLIGWRAADALAILRSEDTPTRRFTGSHETRSYGGNSYPVTNNPGEGENPIDLAAWRLLYKDLDGVQLVFTYPELLALPSQEIDVTIDCTLGWFSTHRWRGVPLQDFFSPIGSILPVAGVELVSASGYAVVIPINEARQVLLATHVDGLPLENWHGFPLRAVVPTRRGWFWVKWLSQIHIKPGY
jgi:hypothetical protein